MNWKQPKVYAVRHKDEAQEQLPDRVVFLQLFRIRFYPTVVWSMGVF